MDIEKKGNGNHEKDLEANKSKTKKTINSEIHKIRVKKDKINFVGDIKRNQKNSNKILKINLRIRKKKSQKHIIFRNYGNKVET